MIRTVKDYEKLSEQYNNMLEERNSLIDDLSWYKAKVSRLERENEKLVWTLKNKEDVIDWNCLKIRGLKEVCSELEHENEKLKEENKGITTAKDRFVKGCYLRNKEILQLKEEKEEFHRKLMAQLEANTELRTSNKDKHAILSEFSQHIGNKPASSTYKYFRAKLDSIGIKEDE